MRAAGKLQKGSCFTLRCRADEHLLCSILSFSFCFPYFGLVKP